MSAKNVFITGGTTGIGLSLAQEYLSRGYNVAICGRDLTKLSDQIKSLKNLYCFQVDVTNLEQLKQAVSLFLQNLDGNRPYLDICIANAGRSVGDKKAGPKFKEARELMEVNYVGVINAFEASFEHLNPAQSHLVAIASVAGLVGLPGAGPYSASKSAVLKFCESMMIDFNNTSINITSILPGFIDTPLTRKNNHPMPFLMPSTKAAKLITAAVDKKKKYFIFPMRMYLIMILLEKMPRFLYRFLITLTSVKEKN